MNSRREALICAEHPVAGIAQAGHDITFFVKPLIQGRDVDVDIRMRFLHRLHPFWRGNQAHQLNLIAFPALQRVNRRDGRAPGSKHRVDHDQQAVRRIRRQINVILLRLQRFMIASKAEGNPFFVEEVVKSLLEQGVLRQENGQVVLARREATSWPSRRMRTGASLSAGRGTR